MKKDVDLETIGRAFSALIARRRLPLLMESFLGMFEPDQLSSNDNRE
jgi:hypothetical protein